MALAALNTYLHDGEARYDQAAKADRWYITLSIPDSDWPADWTGVPARGSAAPVGGQLAKFNIQGTCLDRSIKFYERAGYTILRLTYGLDIINVEVNTAYVTGRTVLVEQDIEYAYTNDDSETKTMVVGVENPAANKGVLTYRRITPNAGYDTTVELPFQQIRLTCFFNAEGILAKMTPIYGLAGALTTAAWTVFGYEFAINQLMYRGATIGLYRDTPGADRIYKCDLDWLGHPFVWNRLLKYSTYEKVAMEMDVIDSAGNVVGGRVVQTFRNETDVATDYQYRKEYDFATLLNGIIVT